jgi:hypothetical protein
MKIDETADIFQLVRFLQLRRPEFLRMKKIDKEIDSRKFLIFNFFKLVQNRIQEWRI